MRRTWGWMAAGCLVACSGPPAQYGSVCRNEPTCPGGNVPGGVVGGGGGGGGGHGDASVEGGADAALPGTITAVTTVLVPTTLPIPTTSTGVAATPTSGWTVSSVADSTITGTSDANGSVTLSGIALAAGVFQLEAIPPTGANTGLTALGTFSATGATSTAGLVAIPLPVLNAAGGGTPIDVASAHLVLQLTGTVTGVSARVTGPTGGGTATQVLYDDDASSRFLEGDTATGSRGTILLLNIPVLATPYAVTITLTRAGNTRSFTWPVERGAVEWLTPAAP